MHIVSTIPANNAEIFAIISDIMHLCSRNLIQPAIYTFIPEISEIDVYQMHHKDDSVAPYAPVDGAMQQETKSGDGGHSIASYREEIESLPEGTYVFRNGHFVPK